jgi:hypothetical protein
LDLLEPTRCFHPLAASVCSNPYRKALQEGLQSTPSYSVHEQVRETGVEPARVSPLDPKSSASANSATLAWCYAPVVCGKFYLPSSAKFFSARNGRARIDALGSPALPDPSACKRLRAHRLAIAMRSNYHGARKTSSVCGNRRANTSWVRRRRCCDNSRSICPARTGAKSSRESRFSWFQDRTGRKHPASPGARIAAKRNRRCTNSAPQKDLPQAPIS